MAGGMDIFEYCYLQVIYRERLKKGGEGIRNYNRRGYFVVQARVIAHDWVKWRCEDSDFPVGSKDCIAMNLKEGRIGDERRKR